MKKYYKSTSFGVNLICLHQSMILIRLKHHAVQSAEDNLLLSYFLFIKNYGVLLCGSAGSTLLTQIRVLQSNALKLYTIIYNLYC